MHFTQAFVYLFEAIAHQFEGCAQALLQRGVQFFIYGLPHQFQLAFVAALQLLQLLRECVAYFLQALGVGFAQAL